MNNNYTFDNIIDIFNFNFETNIIVYNVNDDICIYNLRTKEFLLKINLKGIYINYSMTTQDSKYLIISPDNTFLIIDLVKFTYFIHEIDDNGNNHGILIKNNGNTITYINYLNNRLEKYDFIEKKIVETIDNFEYLKLLKYNPDGKYLIVSSGDLGKNPTLKVLDSESYEVIFELVEPHKGFIKEIEFSPDGKYLTTTAWESDLSNEKDGYLYFTLCSVWDFEKRELKYYLGENFPQKMFTDYNANKVFYSKDGKYNIVGIDEVIINHIVIFETESGKIVKIFTNDEMDFYYDTSSDHIIYSVFDNDSNTSTVIVKTLNEMIHS
ncbi:MAG: hypothetical protein U0354_14810 [Candidatus Sericytochromatia bacterium]